MAKIAGLPVPEDEGEDDLNSRHRISRLAVRLTIVAAASLALSGCLDQDRPGFAVVNGTDAHLEVVIEVGGSERLLDDDVEPGLVLYTNGLVNGGECIDARITARNQAGEIVATFPGPVCDGTRWEVVPPT